MRINEIASYALLALLWAFGAALLFHKTALRDEVACSALRDAGELPYSFSRVQLWAWVIVIISASLYGYAHAGVLWKCGPSTLALLGISSGTAIAARAIDGRDMVAGSERHQGDKSQGFFVDILSDQNGVSIHRFQALFFNLLYALVYVLDVINEPGRTHLPEIDPSSLVLLGMSSGTYAAMKTTENKPVLAGTTTSSAVAPAAGHSDELLDPEPDGLAELH